MKRFAAVALREVAERRFVLVAAAAAATIPFLVPLLPGLPAGDGPIVRSVVALTLACAFGLGGSLLVGASVVGRELAEKRLSFHFARPLAAPVVWGGKLVGGLALVLLSEAVVLLPASVAGGEFPGLPGLNLDTPVLWSILFCAVPFFLLAWVGSVALRSRSPWLVVDLVLLMTMPALLFSIVRRLLRYGHMPKPSWALAAVGVLLVALFAATLAQVVAGRTDARRGHGAQSLALWGLLLVATAVGAALAERVIDPGVERLVRAWAEPAGPGGDWVFVRGSARENGEGSTSYLLNLATGESRLLPVGWTAAVSADGSRALSVTSPSFDSKEVVVEAIGLQDGGTASLDLREWPEGIALADDGRRLAVVSGGVCSVYELPALRSLASVRVPPSRWAYEPRFVSPDRVRLHPRRSWRRLPDESPLALKDLEDPVALELSVAKRAVTPLATYPVSSIPLTPRKAAGPDPGPVFHLLPSPGLDRVLVLGFGSARGVRLLDAASGRLLAAFDGSEESGHPVGTFLADGRAVVAEAAPEGRRLVVLSPDGARLSEIALAAGTKRVRFGNEPAKGLLALGLSRDASSGEWESALVELDSGRLRPTGAEALYRAFWSENLSIPPPGSPATRLAHEKGTGRLVLYEPATGEAKPLTRGFAARK